MDPFDQAWGDTSSATSISDFDMAWDGGIPAEASDIGAIKGAAVRGIGGLLGIADELMPQFYRDKTGAGVSMPHIFGLFEKKDTPVSFRKDFESLLGYGENEPTVKPSSEIGKVLNSAVEAGSSAAPFGPLAMLASSIYGGVGGYGGEKIGEAIPSVISPETGRMVGSAITQLTPASLIKSGAIKEAARKVGPLLSQFPLIGRMFGKDAAIDAAVGRAITKGAQNIDNVENVLATISPATDELSNLKTTAELVGDPGLARVEDMVHQTFSSSPFKTLSEQRQGLRAGEVFKGYDPTTNLYETSKALEGVVAKSAENLDEAADVAWGLLPKDAQLVGNHLNDDLLRGVKEATIDGNVPLTGSAKGILDRFFNQASEGPMTFEQIQALRRKALEVGRGAKGDLSEAGQLNRRISSLVEEHLRKIVNDNAAAGIISPDDVAKWEAAREATKLPKVAFGAKESGTSALEKIGLEGESVDNVTLIKEGLNSPDKLAAHLRAAALGGEDARPLYQQALKSELDGKPPSQWADIVNRRRTQWEMVFSPDEMAMLDRNLLDIESELIKNRMVQTGNSLTDTRKAIRERVMSEKGLADLVNNPLVRQIPVLGGAIQGANVGWQGSDSALGGVGNALLYGGAGALLGKAFQGRAQAASDKFDDLLIAALRNPKTMQRVIEAAKPGNLTQILSQAALGAGRGAIAPAASSGLNSLFKSVFPKPQQVEKQEEQNSPTSGLNTSGENLYKQMSMDNSKTPDIAIVEQEIDKDPYYSALYEAESGRNPKAKNPQSTAKGGFQFIDSTAKGLGLDDPLDLSKSFEAVKSFTDRHRELFGNDPALLYSAHYLGETVLRKLLNGLPLSKQQQSQVEYLKEKALPDFLKIYKKKASIEV